MKRTAGFVSLIAALGLFACGSGTGQEDIAEGAGAATGKGAVAAAVAVGEYGIDNGSIGGTLTIETVSAAEVRFSLGVLNKFGGQNQGDLETSTAHAKSGGWEFTNNDDCTIRLAKKNASTITVTQTGSCLAAGFGANVDGSGDYSTETAAKNAGPVAAVGTYALTDDPSVRTGELTVDSADTHAVKLSIEVQNLTGAMNEGALGPVVLEKVSAGVFSYGGNDDGCAINAKVSGATIEITEFAECQLLGANVHLAGTYKKK